MDYKTVLLYLESILDEVSAFQLSSKKAENFNVVTKISNIDMVTDIDHQSEVMIIEKIRESYPEHSFLAEETGVIDRESDYVWVIDPIDGTTNFIHGFPMHCISVGLKYQGHTVLGIVDAPVMGMRFTAILGQGSWLNGEALHVSKNDSLVTSVIATGFPYTRKTDNMNLPYFNKIVNEVAGIRRSGSAALDLCMVAAGMLDAYWEFALNEWDICAGVLMIEEAGGIVTQEPIGTHTLLTAANKGLHEVLLKTLLND